MKQLKYKKIIPYLLIGILTVFFCWLFVGRYGMFGSKVDWMSQHSVIPDYFRQQFYETGNFFPEFAPNIGGGQNIYHFSYYGLYSPIILVSYLFPFIKMSDYMMAASGVCLALSVMLFYSWLVNRGISREISFLTAINFLLAGPMIFHSYGQIMFVNYMPFLCLALRGIDSYFEKGKLKCYTFGVLLMILTSFYFSIGGMLVLVLYGIYRYFQIKEDGGIKVKISGFLIDGIKFLLPMGTAVLISGVLLVPTAMALAGKRNMKSVVRLRKLLLPDFSILGVLYHPYGIGLTTFVITVMITGLIYKKWSERILNLGCAIVMLFPLFRYLLNGGLYVRDKVLIPFLPMLCYLTAYYLEKQKRREISFVNGLVPFLLTIALLILEKNHGEYGKWFMIDGIIMAVCFLVFWRKQYVWILAVVPIMFLLIYGMALHKNADKMAEPEFYNRITNQNMKNIIQQVIKEDNDFYRLEQEGTNRENEANINRIWDGRQYVTSLYSSSYNENYQKFRKETFLLEQPFRNFLMQSEVKNPVFQRFMGVKYILSKRKLKGYKLYKTVGKIHVYKNSAVSPIAYATNQVISEKEYSGLEYPYNQTALLSVAVTDTKETGKKQETVVSELKLPETKYHIEAKKSQTVRIPIPEAGKCNVLFMEGKVKNHQSSQDVAIWLEGTRNKLSSTNHIYYNENTVFHYTIALEKGQREVKLKFGKGDYEVADIKCYIADLDKQSADLYQSEFLVNQKETKGNKISGTIDVLRDGYFITTIPYDSAFEIRIDGKKAVSEKVNTSFLGTKIDKGNHKVEMIYHASGVMIGKFISLTGIILFLVLKKTRQRWIIDLSERI